MEVGSSSTSAEHDLIEPARRSAEELSAALGHGVSKVGTIPGYDVVREIHRGGQGVVYEAIQHSTKRSVAIKVLHEGALANSQAVARFEREVEILGQFQHPNIVPIHDSGRVNGRYYYVMDLIVGRPLDRFLDHRRDSIAQILKVFATVCHAVNAAHLRGIIHRDLKPSNIRMNGRGEPFIIDFGLAKIIAHSTGEGTGGAGEMTITGQFVGSLPWASPEQVEGRWSAVDTRSDVYSLGVVLYRLLTGAFPYPVTGSPRKVLNHIVGTEPERPSLIHAKIDHEVEMVVLKCLAKDPTRRYQTGGELARDILRYLEGEPIEARSNSSWYVFRKALGRHRAVATSLAVIAALVTGAAVLSTSLWRSAVRQRDRAQSMQNILVTALQSIEPSEAKGKDTPLLEMMTKAAGLIETTLDRQPVVEAALRYTIGTVYGKIGNEMKAEEQLRAALDLQRHHVGTEHTETLATTVELAWLLRRQFRFPEAEVLNRAAVLGYMNTLGAVAHETRQAQRRLADVLAAKGDRAEAIALYRMLLTTPGPIPPAEDSETYATMSDLARLLQVQERFEEAESYFRQALAGMSRLQGVDSQDAQIMKVNVGHVLVRQGKLAEAEPMMRGAMDGLVHLLGERHRLTIAVRSRLAKVLLRLERFDEAEALFRQSLRIAREELGDEDGETLAIMNRLAQTLRKSGKLPESEQLFRSRLDRLISESSGRYMLSTARISLADVLFELGRSAEAEPLLDLGIDDARSTLSTETPLDTGSFFKMGTLATKHGRHEQAERLYRDLVAFQRDESLPQHVHLPHSLCRLADSLDQLGNRAEAEKVLEEAETLFVETYGRGAPDTAKKAMLASPILDCLVKLYTRWDQPDKAARYDSMLSELEQPPG